MSKPVMIIDEWKWDALNRKFDRMEATINKLAARNNLSLKEKWLVSNEVCKVLDISIRKLQQLRTNGEIVFKKHGRKIYYRASDVQIYLDGLAMN